jgi:hypothetical protein
VLPRRRLFDHRLSPGLSCPTSRAVVAAQRAVHVTGSLIGRNSSAAPEQKAADTHHANETPGHDSFPLLGVDSENHHGDSSTSLAQQLAWPMPQHCVPRALKARPYRLDADRRRDVNLASRSIASGGVAFGFEPMSAAAAHLLPGGAARR